MKSTCLIRGMVGQPVGKVRGVGKNIEYAVFPGTVACLHDSSSHHPEVIDIPAGIEKRNGFGGATSGRSKQNGSVFLIQCSTGVFDAGEEGTKNGAWTAAKFFRVWKNEEIADSPLGDCNGEVGFTGEREFGKILQISEVRWINAKAL